MKEVLEHQVWIKHQMGIGKCARMPMPHLRIEEKDGELYLAGKLPPKKEKSNMAMWVTGIIDLPENLRMPEKPIWWGVSFCSHCLFALPARGFWQLNSHVFLGPSLGEECPCCKTPIHNFKGNGGVISFDTDKDKYVSQKLRAWIAIHRKTGCLNTQHFTYGDIPILEKAFDDELDDPYSQEALEYIKKVDEESADKRLY